MRVKIVPKNERDFTTEEYKDKLRDWLDSLPGLQTEVMPIGMFEGEEQERPIEIRLYGPNQDVLNSLSREISKKIMRIPGVVDPTSSLQVGAPEYKIIPDRNRINALGLSTADVAMTIRSMVDGVVASQFRKEEREIDIRVMLNPDDVNEKQKLEGISILSPEGKKIPLKAIADIEEVTGPTEIQRENRQRLVYITADFSAEYNFGNISNQIKEYLNEFEKDLPFGYEVKMKGETEGMEDMFRDMGMAMLIAIIFVYIVLAVQYNSFVHPLTIMLALPLSIVGAFLFIFLFNGNLDMMTMIGLILLMGIVNKNSILLVDFILQYRKDGMDRREAILKAGPNRLRPILMTTAAMIMGMLPIAIGIGEGSEFRRYMGIAVIGGLLTSTFLTLVVVPVFYSILDDFQKRFVNRKTKTA
jgi:HAE1 family hydrophobic/amphiphilic exporter-1